ncbi:class I SAM-dependent methyltransferase [Flavobacterium sp. FlaQc-48]|uniref:class I SAM-dependent methyltransferase n=1 Tax=Flavobacterium sp. FlaQc-48 TaxID=3374181 RepID=UPI0037567DB4
MNEIIQYYNDLASTYDQNRFSNSYGRFIDFQERKILDTLLTDQKEQILDLACGTGRLLNYASIGVDASFEMIEVAKRKFPEKTFLQSEAGHILLEDNCIDTVISFHFFMHLDHSKINEVLEESNRILKKKGRIIFDIPSRKRRNLFGYKKANWHGASSFSINDFKVHPNFKVKRTFGFLFFPIHRFPDFCRKFLLPLDSFLASSFLKEYSSYLIIELEKK